MLGCKVALEQDLSIGTIFRRKYYQGAPLNLSTRPNGSKLDLLLLQLYQTLVILFFGLRLNIKTISLFQIKVEKYCKYDKTIYQQIFSDFSSDPKNIVKKFKKPTTYSKMRSENTMIFLHVFLFFYSDYDLNLCRYLNPKLPPMRYFRTQYFLNRHTWNFVWVIKLNQLYLPNQTCTYKNAIIAEIQRYKFKNLLFYISTVIASDNDFYPK